MIISFLNLDPFFNGDGKGDILHQNQKNRVLRYVHVVLQNKKINAIIGNKSDSIILLLPAGGVTGREDIKAAVFNLAEQFLKAIDQGAPDLKAVIGIGRHYSSVLELWKSFQEAKKAVEIGKNISEERIIHFDDLGVFRLLYNFASDKEIRQFYDEFARPIVEYDKKHGTELTKTLETFYECNGNLKKVSEKLYTHYNTILYRIQRIQEIIGVNLERASDRLSVEIALKLMKVMEYKQT
jgi:purine catabolism regulator